MEDCKDKWKKKWNVIKTQRHEMCTFLFPERGSKDMKIIKYDKSKEWSVGCMGTKIFCNFSFFFSLLSRC